MKPRMDFVFSRLRGVVLHRIETRLENVTTLRTAATLDAGSSAGVVVVGQLFARPDPSRGADPDRVPLDVDITIGPAPVIDVACEIAADGGIADPPPVDVEDPDSVSWQIAQLALLAFSLRDELALVLDNARVPLDRLARVDPPAGDGRAPAQEARKHVHCDIESQSNATLTTRRSTTSHEAFPRFDNQRFRRLGTSWSTRLPTSRTLQKFACTPHLTMRA